MFFSFCRKTVIVILGALALNSQAQTLSDPTRPANAVGIGSAQQSVTKDPLTLEAIFIRDNMRRAVINGMSLREGDSHLGALLLKVNSTSVIVEHSTNGVKDVRELKLMASGDIKTHATDTF